MLKSIKLLDSNNFIILIDEHYYRTLEIMAKKSEITKFTLKRRVEFLKFNAFNLKDFVELEFDYKTVIPIIVRADFDVIEFANLLMDNKNYLSYEYMGNTIYDDCKIDYTYRRL